MTYPRSASVIEELESRTLCAAVALTNAEQFMVEYINRSRANPLAEAARLGIDLNQGLTAGTISSAAKQPLTVNAFLTGAARAHSQWMIDTDVFSHTGVGNSNPGTRMANSGYVFGGSYSWAENIAWNGTTGSMPTAEAMSPVLADQLFRSPSHRTSLMNGDFKEVGTGIVMGVFRASNVNYNAGMATQNFAYSGSGVFFTGVVYSDTVNANSFYTPGEGLGSVSIVATNTATNQTFATSTFSTGGYSLAVPAGTYNLVASGGALGSPRVYANVSIGSINVKRDFTPTMTPSGTVGPAVATSGGLLPVGLGTTWTFSVTLTSTRGLTTASLGAGDFTVNGPNGFSAGATFLSVAAGTTANTWVVRYSFPAPGGSWDAGDNGSYSINVNSNQILDGQGFASVASNVGSMTVAIASTAGWNIVGSADFTNDGVSDVLWKNDVTGEVHVWVMSGANGNQRQSSVAIATVPYPEWRIVGAADFTGDNRPDILWRNQSTGEVHLWPMNGTTVTPTVVLRSVTNRDWQIAGTGDIDGDAKADILWRNYSTGDNSVWLMNRTTLRESLSIKNVATAWVLSGVGDFNKDNLIDLVWRNFQNGANALWLMSRTTMLSSFSLASDTVFSRRIIGTADLNRDGSPDILWQDGLGAGSAWYMFGTTRISTAALLS